MKHQDKFKKKYGIDAIDFVEKADLEYFGIAKTLGIQSILKSYAEKKGINIELNDEFYKDLVEAFAEAGKKFPYNEKIKFDKEYKLEPTPVNPSIPKSKGVLEDFKDIIERYLDACHAQMNRGQISLQTIWPQYKVFLQSGLQL